MLPPVIGERRLGPAAIARLVRVASRHDVLHTHLWAADTWGRVAGRLAGRPVLTTEHNTRPDAGWRGRVSTGMARLSTRIACVSPAASAAARAAGVPASRLCVVPNGIDLGHHRPLPFPPGAPPRVLFTGRLVPQKGADVLLDALAQMHRPPGLAVRMLGEGPMRERLAAHAAVRDGTARLLGWQADPREHLGWCSLVVMPSRWEGFGLVALEALAAGRPVLASGVDALPELVGGGGWLVPPDDAPALARGLAAALGDPAALAARAARGPGLARRFTLDRMVDDYASMWRALHQGAPRAYNAPHA